MVTKSELVDVIRSASNPEEFRELNWTGTFGQYLGMLRRNSLVTEQHGVFIATDILWP